MYLDLKLEIIRRFGSQIRASRELGLSESRLSRLIQGHAEPTEDEERLFANRLGLRRSRQPQPPEAA